MISAKGIGVIYIILGKISSISKDIYVDRLSSQEGYKIVGSQTVFNLGMSISNAGDFNKDGYPDIIFSGMSAKNSQGTIYILFGNSTFQDIHLDSLNTSSTTKLLTITSPPFSFAGMSVSGVGDINSDGYDDIAIGSLPYKGGYQTQRTYLIYGRDINQQQQENSENDNNLDLSLLNEGIDGITITGGGFMVAGPGDVNGDGISDLMIVNYPNWQGKSNFYLL
jgi:hypothetical protein